MTMITMVMMIMTMMVMIDDDGDDDDLNDCNTSIFWWCRFNYANLAISLIVAPSPEILFIFFSFYSNHKGLLSVTQTLHVW